jgi:hypothetical protein
MPLVKLKIAPGVYRNVTPYQGETRWYDTNLVRWVGEMLEPVGGWQKFQLTPVTGTCRGLFSWRDNSDFRWLAIGTNEKLYVHDESALSDITPSGFNTGFSTSLPGLGFGALFYGDQEYGNERTGTSSIVTAAATWTFDTWGEYLVSCCTADGKIYEWQLNTGVDAVAVTNAPISNIGTFVSEQRHLVALGAGGDPRVVQWSDAEDRTDWTPSSTNQAGSFQLGTAGHLKRAVKTRGEVLLLTSTDAHAMRYVGTPLVFQFDRVGSNCGIAGPNAASEIEAGVVWMGTDARFYMYNGVVQPVPCDVEDWVEVEIDRNKLAEVYSGTLSEHGEVWWFFVAADTTTKYVVWNYRSGHWVIGTLDRTAWLDRGVWRHPIAISSDGYLYQHEQGYTDSGLTRVGDVYAESGAMEIYPGEEIVDVVQILPDERNNGDVSVTLKCKYTPSGAETTYGPYTVRADGYTDTRASGRQAKIRVDALNDNDWRVGTFRADLRLGARR